MKFWYKETKSSINFIEINHMIFKKLNNKYIFQGYNYLMIIRWYYTIVSQLIRNWDITFNKNHILWI